MEPLDEFPPVQRLLDTTLLEEVLTQVQDHAEPLCVFGSANADYTVRVDWLPAKGQTVLGKHLQVLGGGKSANQAVCAGKLGAQVSFVGATGADAAGGFLKENLDAAGVDTSGMFCVDEPTGSAFIQVDPEGKNSIVVAPGANACVTEAHVHEHEAALTGAKIVSLAGEIPEYALVEAATVAHGAGATVVFNASPYDDRHIEYMADITNILLMNDIELSSFLLNNTYNARWWTADIWRHVASEIMMRGYRDSVITLGQNGSVALYRGEPHFVPPVNLIATDTTGCGDAYAGALISALAADIDLQTAADFASVVAGFAATKSGAQPSYPSPQELLEFADYYRGRQDAKYYLIDKGWRE